MKSQKFNYVLEISGFCKENCFYFIVMVIFAFNQEKISCFLRCSLLFCVTHLVLPVVWKGQMVILSIVFLIVIHEGIQVREIAIQVHISGVPTAHQVTIELWTLEVREFFFTIYTGLCSQTAFKYKRKKSFMILHQILYIVNGQMEMESVKAGVTFFLVQSSCDM